MQIRYPTLSMLYNNNVLQHSDSVGFCFHSCHIHTCSWYFRCSCKIHTATYVGYMSILLLVNRYYRGLDRSPSVCWWIIHDHTLYTSIPKLDNWNVWHGKLGCWIATFRHGNIMSYWRWTVRREVYGHHQYIRCHCRVVVKSLSLPVSLSVVVVVAAAAAAAGVLVLLLLVCCLLFVCWLVGWFCCSSSFSSLQSSPVVARALRLCSCGRRKVARPKEVPRKSIAPGQRLGGVPWKIPHL